MDLATAVKCFVEVKLMAGDQEVATSDNGHPELRNNAHHKVYFLQIQYLY